jgi:hypothetical protein
MVAALSIRTEDGRMSWSYGKEWGELDENAA